MPHTETPDIVENGAKRHSLDRLVGHFRDFDRLVRPILRWADNRAWPDNGERESFERLAADFDARIQWVRRNIPKYGVICAEEMPLKQWVNEEATRCGLTAIAIYNRIVRGKYPQLRLRRVNKRVVFVVPNASREARNDSTPENR